MPRRIAKACRARACANTTTNRSGYCEQHKGEGWARHNGGRTAAQRGYGGEWNRTRLTVMKRDKGLCQLCLADNVITPATQVDHIKPKAHGGTDELSNLACICGPHHRAKTARERLRPRLKA